MNEDQLHLPAIPVPQTNTQLTKYTPEGPSSVTLTPPTGTLATYVSFLNTIMINIIIYILLLFGVIL